MSDAFAVPELTRGLRAFASPRSLGGTHDLYFAPLLDARRAARAATRWASRVSAFDAERLEATMRVTVRGFAAERFPDSAPDRRALAAQLEDACEDLFSQIGALAVAQAAVQSIDDDSQRGTAWSRWTAALLAVFAAADRGWEHLAVLLPREHTGKHGARRARRER